MTDYGFAFGDGILHHHRNLRPLTGAARLHQQHTALAAQDLPHLVEPGLLVGAERHGICRCGAKASLASRTNRCG
jgi:hypothetical protein